MRDPVILAPAVHCFLLPRSFRPLSCLLGAYAISEARFHADQQFEAPSPNQRVVRHLGSARRRTGWRSIVMCRRRVRSDPRTPSGTGNSSRFKVAGPARTAWVKAASSSGVSCCSGLAGAGSAANSGRPPPSATSPSPAHPVSVRLQRSWLRSAQTVPNPDCYGLLIQVAQLATRDLVGVHASRACGQPGFEGRIPFAAPPAADQASSVRYGLGYVRVHLTLGWAQTDGKTELSDTFDAAGDVIAWL